MSQHPANPAAPPGATWSPAQLIRLESEWRKLQRSFAYHPLVQIIPLAGDPPAEYQVQYKVTTLAINQAGQLAYISTCPIHIWLPPQFPHAPPTVRPMTPVFHPNVTMEWVYTTPPWGPTASLAALVTQIGQILAYQTWDVASIANHVAADWLTANAHLVPTDPTADFSPNNGGEPLARIMRFGTQTVEQIKGRVREMSDRLVSPMPPSVSEMRRFAEQTRQSLGVFSDADIPDHMRAAAVELDEVALSMLAEKSPWEALAKRFVAADQAMTGIDELATALGNAAKAQAAFEALAPAPPKADDPVATVAQVPPPTALQAAAQALRKASRDAENRFKTLRERTAALQGLPEPQADVTPGGMLAERLQAEIVRAAETVDAARARATAALAEAEPLAEQARRKLAAADRITQWAEYADLLRQGNALLTRLMGAGPTGIQSYFLRTDQYPDEYGPFEYEQRLDAYELRMAVSSLAPTHFDVIDTRNGQVIAHGEGGELAAGLRGKGGAAMTVVVRPAEHTEELRVQLEYMLTETRERMNHLRELPPLAETDAWAYRYEAAVRPEAALGRVLESHRQTRQAWKGLLLDLAVLGRYKQRLATHFQIERVSELVPRVFAEIDKAQTKLNESTQRLADIAARSGRNPDTEQLIIPNRFAQEYADKNRDRERALRDLPRLRELLANAAAQVRKRLSASKLVGVGGVPTFHVLPPLPDAWVQLDPMLSNEQILGRLAALAARLDTPIVPEKLVLPDPVGPPVPAGAVAAGAATGMAGEDALMATATDGLPLDTVAGGEPTPHAVPPPLPAGAEYLGEDTAAADPHAGDAFVGGHSGTEGEAEEEFVAWEHWDQDADRPEGER